MVSNNIFYAFLVLNLEIEFLKKEDQRMSLALASFFIMRYLSAEWLVKILILDPSR